MLRTHNRQVKQLLYRPFLKKKLIIFTRYPVPGRTKTRLTPALGATEAADLQRWMSERTIQTAAKLAAQSAIAVEIHYTGTCVDQMRNWLGIHHQYREQGDGNLGDRMSRAIAASCGDGYQQVIIIGSDCPRLSAPIIAQGFSRLTNHDLVLGPARDGGYYLIGLTRPCPELFTNRSWGSKLLLAETISGARQLALKFYLLKELADVDRPEDLHYFSNYPDPE